ncbi:LysR family transcriptional regulator [Shewanella gaetbuli]|uniref:LysR family transcriptional regulator n=1 Tax=Shewanella gaetbuli TaxID=220752 RepID=A0A9X1ZMM5_9GAMM|nr:LysR family transcriptional regulator [Shewanella gaetbuli]MCL1143742.1 LysR family transcriptional regulator [Shewanella gaetbuli]
MNINDLELFILVAEQGSFAKAAESLNTRRALVSRRIAELEKQLGAPLFTRTTRAMSLTPSGELYLEQISPLLKQLKNAAMVFKNRYNEVQGSIRVGLLPFVDKILDHKIASFVHTYPQVKLDIEVVSGGYKDISRLELDLVIDINHIQDNQFVAKKLLSFERKIYASPGYLEKSSVIENLNDLQYQSLLGFRGTSGLVEEKWRFQQNTISANHKVVCSDYNSLYNLCLGGAGITLLPQVIAQEAVENNQLINVLPELSAGFTDLTLIYPVDHAFSSAAKVFVEHLTRQKS